MGWLITAIIVIGIVAFGLWWVSRAVERQAQDFHKDFGSSVSSMSQALILIEQSYEEKGYFLPDEMELVLRAEDLTTHLKKMEQNYRQDGRPVDPDFSRLVASTGQRAARLKAKVL